MSEFVGEEEVVETEEVLPEESPSSDVVEEESGGVEQSLDKLVRSLELPLETLRFIATSEEGKLLLEKVEEHFNQKDREIEEYESALNDFTQNMTQQASDKEEEISTLQDSSVALTGTVEDLSEQLEVTKNALIEEMSKVETLQNSNAVVTGTVEELSEKLEEEQSTVESLKKQLKEDWAGMESFREQLSEETSAAEELRERLEEEESNVAELKETIRTKELEVEEVLEREQRLQEDFTLTKDDLETRLGDCEARLLESQETVKMLSIPPTDIPGADRHELLRLLDRRQHEIDQLSEEWKNQSAKLASMSAEGSKLQTRLDELVSEDSGLKLKEKLLEQEKDLLKTQNDWMTQELECKSEQLLQLRKERCSVVGELESQLSLKDEEVKHLSTNLEALKKSYSELESKAEGYTASMKRDKEEHSRMEELLRGEMAHHARLAELYQTGGEESEQRVQELLGAMEKIQALLNQVSKEKEDLRISLDEENIRHDSRERELLAELESKKVELSHANELVASLRKKGGEVLLLSPAAAKASALLKSGMSLTQIYSKYVEVTEELQQVTDEKGRLENYIEEVNQELEEKTPALLKLRRDHDQAVLNCDQLTMKLNSLFEECETLRMESEDSIQQSRASERENARLKLLVGDLGRQVKVLLKECEEARGGVASSTPSLSYSSVTDSADISSSSQVITQELVDFRNVEQLQEQNQRLLTVVRELSQQNEERERQTVEDQTKELQSQLQSTQQELANLKEFRERQKEMVQAVVNQRDMYRTLLAQATPLPPEQSLSVSRGSLSGSRRGGEGERLDVTDMSEGVEEVSRVSREAEETRRELEELREQFEAYKKEKMKNDSMLQEQLDKMRDESSEIKIHNAKLGSKLEYSKERYGILETNHKALKTELDTMREKNSKLSGALSSHQEKITITTDQLFTARDKLSRLEVAHEVLKSSYSLLESQEKQARAQYESVLKENHGHRELMVNLQNIQNNFERSEFETKTKLGAQIEALEREVSLSKDRLHAEEERRSKMMDAYDTQVKDLEQRLTKAGEAKSSVEEKLKTSEHLVQSLETELQSTKSSLESSQSQLKEIQDKVLRLEHDAGSEFRGKIRLLERQKADLEGQVSSLETQLRAAKEHTEQYQTMSQAYEQQLHDSNTTHDLFKTEMESQVSQLTAQRDELTEKSQQLEAAKKELEEQLQDYTEETSQQVADLEGQISTLESERDALQLELTSSGEELDAAREDIKKFAESVTETQSLYQHELMQHGKSMEELFAAKELLQADETELLKVQQELKELQEHASSCEKGWAVKELQLESARKKLEERLEDLTKQNDVLHAEAEKLSARLLIQQESTKLDTSEVGATSEVELNTSGSSGDKSAEQLWEVIRYVRREKEIAETCRKLAEADNLRHKQLLESTQRQLSSVKAELMELCDTATSRTQTAAQHAEILQKVEHLNLLRDSNRLLREERDRQLGIIKELEDTRDGLEREVGPLREANKQLLAQKDALVAEKTALRNEVQRWNVRTNQLIEQYNKVDPEEYKKLLEERDSTATQMETLSSELVSTSSQLLETQSSLESTREELAASVEATTQLNQDLTGAKDQITQLTEEKENQQKLIGKLREVGIKHRNRCNAYLKIVDQNKAEIAELKKKLEEAPAVSEPSPAAASELADMSKKLDESKQEVERVQTELRTVQTELRTVKESFSKAQNTIRAARNRIHNITSEKEQTNKELEELKTENTRLTSEQSSLQQRMDVLQSKHEEEMEKHETMVAKLQTQLKERGTRRKVVVSKVPASTHAPSQSTAPTAAVKPTVTTTPTASIRPMGIQTTSAPTALVTPTMVSTQHLIPSTSLPSTNTTTTATPFVRSTSPLVPLPSNNVQGNEISQSSNTATSLGPTSATHSQAPPTMTTTAAVAAVPSGVPPVLAMPPMLVQLGGTAVTAASVVPTIAGTVVGTSSPALLLSSSNTAASPAVVLPSISTPVYPITSTASNRMSTSTASGVAASVSTPLTLVSSAVITSSEVPAPAATITAMSSGPVVSLASVASQVATVSASSVGPSEGGVVVGVVGSVGTSEGDERVAVKRKRRDDGEEPGSSVGLPSSKKRHIRLRPRVQVSASSSQAPDTQGTSMQKVPPLQQTQQQPQSDTTSPVSQDSSSYPQVSTVTDTTQDNLPTQQSPQPPPQEQTLSQGATWAESAPISTSLTITAEQIPPPQGIVSMWVESAPISTSLMTTTAVTEQLPMSTPPPLDVVSSGAPQQLVTVSSEGVGVVQPTAPVEPMVRVPLSSDWPEQANVAATQGSPVTSQLVISSSEEADLREQREAKELSPQASPSDAAERRPPLSVGGSDQLTLGSVDSSESLDRAGEAQLAPSPVTTDEGVPVSAEDDVDVAKGEEEMEGEESAEEAEERMEDEVEEVDEGSRVREVEEGPEMREVGQVDEGLEGQEEAIMEAADTTQIEDLRDVSEPASEMVSEAEEEEDEERGEDVSGEAGPEYQEEEEEEEPTSQDQSETDEEQEEETEEEEVGVEEEEEEEEEEGESEVESEEEIESEDEQCEKQAMRMSRVYPPQSYSREDDDVIVIGSDSEPEPEEEEEGLEEEEEEEEDEEEDEEIDREEEEDSDEEDGGNDGPGNDEDGDSGTGSGTGGDSGGDSGMGSGQAAPGSGGGSEGEGVASHDQSSQAAGDSRAVAVPSSGSMDSEHGLPDDETSIDIPPSSVQAPPLRPTSFPSSRRQALRFGERQTSIPGVEVHVGDGVVPHTPVLNERKQLVMSHQRAQTIPSTPADQPAYVVPQLAESSLTATTSQPSTDLQSLGEQFEYVPDVVPPSAVPQAPPTSLATEQSNDDADGDITDSLMAEIVGGAGSSEEEEGEITEPDGDEDDPAAPPPGGISNPVPTISTTRNLRSSAPSTSSTLGTETFGEEVGSVGTSQQESVSDSTMSGDQPAAKKVKPSPIVWSQPSASSADSGSEPGGRGGRKIIRAARRGGAVQQTGSRRNIRLKGTPSRKL